MTQFNPILPLDTYIPDGEPHVFGDRIYLFGSHDKEGGDKYCQEGNYMGWSAPLDHPTEWTSHGIIYEPSQDPEYVAGDNEEMYAPDVMQGVDGRYYLYYCFGGTAGHSRIGVAVCDSPAGKYEYYGNVQNPDGSVCSDYLMGDPGVINDDGVPRLVCGWSLSMVAAAAHGRGQGTTNASQEVRWKDQHDTPAPQMPQLGDPDMNIKMAPIYQMLFHRSLDQVKDLEYPLMGSNAYTLEDDMITVKEGPFRIVAGQFDTPKDSEFFGHAFYEAASIRKINGRYYFIYSSENSNELCYATSQNYNGPYHFGGTIISNGDVGYHGRRGEDRTNQTANDHGSLACIKGQWYIFHHRQTHSGTFSRQACVEPVRIAEDGSIAQVECTSMGFHMGALETKGSYPAIISCVLTNGAMPHITNTLIQEDMPYITNDGEERYITGVKNGVTVGYKYFAFDGKTKITLTYRGAGEGSIHAYLIDRGQILTAESQVPEKASYQAEAKICPQKTWDTAAFSLDAVGEYALYLTFEGENSIELKDMAFEN